MGVALCLCKPSDIDVPCLGTNLEPLNFWNSPSPDFHNVILWWTSFHLCLSSAPTYHSLFCAYRAPVGFMFKILSFLHYKCSPVALMVLFTSSGYLIPNTYLWSQPVPWGKWVSREGEIHTRPSDEETGRFREAKVASICRQTTRTGWREKDQKGERGMGGGRKN